MRRKLAILEDNQADHFRPWFFLVNFLVFSPTVFVLYVSVLSVANVCVCVFICVYETGFVYQGFVGIDFDILI